MSDAVAVAIISGGLALLGVIITSISTSRNMTAQLERNQAVIDTKIEELTREVRLHNNFAERIPVMEQKIKVINHRIDDLENYHKGV
jgi:predicted metal-dependent hydrolase